MDCSRSWINSRWIYFSIQCSIVECLIEPQVLVTDFWSRFMTSVVAVSLTLTNPSKILLLGSSFFDFVALKP